jgi:hypothetical protein
MVNELIETITEDKIVSRDRSELLYSFMTLFFKMENIEANQATNSILILKLGYFISRRSSRDHDRFNGIIARVDSSTQPTRP